MFLHGRGEGENRLENGGENVAKGERDSEIFGK